MANDRTSNRGPVWSPRICFLLPRPRLDTRAEPDVPPSADETGGVPGGSLPTSNGQPDKGSELAPAGGRGKGSGATGCGQSGAVLQNEVIAERRCSVLSWVGFRA